MSRPREAPGVCRKCGCTDEFACEGGCAWANAEHTLCTCCAPIDGTLKPKLSAKKKRGAK